MLHQIRYKGISVAYDFRKKKGKPTVVLLHGFLESKKIWEDYAKELAKKYAVINVDLLGHGLSECTGYVHTMEDMADQVMAVLKAHGIRKGIFVGHSMGGYVSLAFAEKYPDNIKGICLFNSSAFADSALKKQERDRAIVVVKKNHERFINEVVPNLFVSTRSALLKGALKQLTNISLSTPKQGIIAALEGMKIRENRELVLKFAPCPVFFIIGKNDKLLPFETLIEQSQLNEGGSYYLSEKGGHLCFFEDKYPCLKALKKFIASVQ